MKYLLWVGIAVLAGCVGSTDASGRRSPYDGGAGLDAQETRRIHLDLIERMLANGRAFAALAHLDALPERDRQLAAARWLRAEALRHVGRAAAASGVYDSLLETDYAGMAQRGLGLLAASAGDLPGAVRHLERARTLLPTNGLVRNDLGYAYLLADALEDAELELRTATELDPADARAARNLLLLLELRGDTAAAARWAQERQLSERVQAVVRDQARSLRAGRGAGERATSTDASVNSADAADACGAALAAPIELLELDRWLAAQRSSVCAGSSPRLPSAAAVRVYREYLSTFSGDVRERYPLDGGSR